MAGEGATCNRSRGALRAQSSGDPVGCGRKISAKLTNSACRSATWLPRLRRRLVSVLDQPAQGATLARTTANETITLAGLNVGPRRVQSENRRARVRLLTAVRLASRRARPEVWVLRAWRRRVSAFPASRRLVVLRLALRPWPAELVAQAARSARAIRAQGRGAEGAQDNDASR